MSLWRVLGGYAIVGALSMGLGAYFAKRGTMNKADKSGGGSWLIGLLYLLLALGAFAAFGWTILKGLESTQSGSIAWFVTAVLVVLAAGVTLGLVGPLHLELADLATARGTITFVVSIMTMGIGIMLVGSLLLAEVPKDAERAAALKDRFSQAREVFTVLAGVLGTIVGFYYGSTEKALGQKTSSSQMTINEARVLGDKAGGERHLVAQLAGGTAPYQYKVTFQLDTGKQGPIEDEEPSSLIMKSFTIPQGTTGKLQLEVTDANKQTAQTTVAL